MNFDKAKVIAVDERYRSRITHRSIEIEQRNNRNRTDNALRDIKISQTRSTQTAVFNRKWTDQQS